MGGGKATTAEAKKASASKVPSRATRGHPPIQVGSLGRSRIKTPPHKARQSEVTATGLNPPASPSQNKSHPNVPKPIANDQTSCALGVSWPFRPMKRSTIAPLPDTAVVRNTTMARAESNFSQCPELSCSVAPIAGGDCDVARRTVGDLSSISCSPGTWALKFSPKWRSQIICGGNNSTVSSDCF